VRVLMDIDLDGLIEFDSRPGRTVFTLLMPFENHELGETA
jgi:nitrogen-specific signal transduction histidine kinase